MPGEASTGHSMWKYVAEQPQMVAATCQSCSGKLTMHGIEKDGEPTSEDAKCMDQSLWEDCGFAHSSLGWTWGPPLVGGPSDEQLPGINQDTHTLKNESALLAGQALTVEQVQDGLNQGIGNRLRKIGLGEC